MEDCGRSAWSNEYSLDRISGCNYLSFVVKIIQVQSIRANYVLLIVIVVLHVMWYAHDRLNVL